MKNPGTTSCHITKKDHILSTWISDYFNVAIKFHRFPILYTDSRIRLIFREYHQCWKTSTKTSTNKHATSIRLIFTFTTADNSHFSLRQWFEFTCDVKSFSDKNSNHCLSPLSLLLLLDLRANDVHFYFTMTKMPRQPPCRPYLLPSIDFNAENTGFLPPSSQPIVCCTRTIWAAIKFGPSPVAFATVSVRIHKFREMAPLLLSTRQQLQPPKHPPYSSIVLKSQVTPLKKQKGECNWYIVFVFLIFNVVPHPLVRTQHSTDAGVNSTAAPSAGASSTHFDRLELWNNERRMETKVSNIVVDVFFAHRYFIHLTNPPPSLLLLCCCQWDGRSTRSSLPDASQSFSFAGITTELDKRWVRLWRCAIYDITLLTNVHTITQAPLLHTAKQQILPPRFLHHDTTQSR